MEHNQRCIQSFAPHGVEFISKEAMRTGEVKTVLVIPPGSSEKNMVVADFSLIEELIENDSTFKALLDAKLIRILDSVPKKYEDVAATLMHARAQLNDVRLEKETVVAEKRELETENAELKKKLEEVINGDNINKPVP
jgi:hypothetical protein